MESEKMKVLFVTTAYQRYKDDVITPWLVKLIAKLQRHGIDTSVFAPSYKGLGNQIINGVRIYRFRYFLRRYERLTHEETAVDRIKRGPLYLILTVFYLVFGTMSIIRLVKDRRYDIIHVHWPFPHIIFGVFAKSTCRARLYSTFYGVEIRWLKKKFPFLIKPFSIFINKSDKITAISTHTAKELDSIVAQKIEIVPFSAAFEEKKGTVTDAREIIFVGRLVERKGVKYLIEAMARISDEIPHRLVIIGDGPEREALQRITKNLNLEGKITFVGRVSDGDLYRYYETCSFLVLPAVYDKKGDIEGLGVVLIEAMSYMKPVIASDAGGITDVVENGVNGLLVPPGDTSALASAIKTLATDDSLRKKMGLKAKAIIDEKFNWNKIVSRLIALYENNK